MSAAQFRRNRPAREDSTGFAIDLGPFFDRLRDYLDTEAQADTLDFCSADAQPQSASQVAEQFIGMISSQFLWLQVVRTDFVPPTPPTLRP
jgi:hypothetical protein